MLRFAMTYCREEPDLFTHCPRPSGTTCAAYPRRERRHRLDACFVRLGGPSHGATHSDGAFVDNQREQRWPMRTSGIQSRRKASSTCALSSVTRTASVGAVDPGWKRKRRPEPGVPNRCSSGEDFFEARSVRRRVERRSIHGVVIRRGLELAPHVSSTS
jgi:hypothetical protein